MKKHTLILSILSVALIVALPLSSIAQNGKPEKKQAYEFATDVLLDHTAVKSQDRTSTCWCWATISMLESEAMRMGKDSVELSEMYIVRHAYSDKADTYVKRQGEMNFPPGGACHDVINQMKKHGLVTDEVYSGLQLGSQQHNHSEIHAVLNAIVDAVVKARRPSIRWKEAYNAVADIYFGTPPETFEYNGKTYTPLKFMDYLGINPDDYIEITSVMDQPMYEQISVILPDNWTFSDEYYNVDVQDLARIAEYSIRKGYSVVFGGDVSNQFFNPVGIVPEDDGVDMKKIEEPVKEKMVTAEMRQELLDNYTTGDDHAMHLVGLSKDQNGDLYFYTKNSWGERGEWKGYQYLSKQYVNLNVTAMMVNKNALPKDIKKKLGL
ncbi:aminopeptidase [bacterium]|nr:aminopeptidase [bacterium]